MPETKKDLDITVEALIYYLGRADIEVFGHTVAEVQQALRVAMYKQTKLEMEANK